MTVKSEEKVLRTTAYDAGVIEPSALRLPAFVRFVSISDITTQVPVTVLSVPDQKAAPPSMPGV